jgi:hypothetical protein
VIPVLDSSQAASAKSVGKIILVEKRSRTARKRKTVKCEEVFFALVLESTGIAKQGPGKKKLFQLSGPFFIYKAVKVHSH